MVRTALCAEVRDGILRVFMPPQQNLEDYLELVASHRRYRLRFCDIPVLMEGYAPPTISRPHDQGTPDPA